jgi:hypothetical protein
MMMMMMMMMTMMDGDDDNDVRVLMRGQAQPTSRGRMGSGRMTGRPPEVCDAVQ